MDPMGIGACRSSLVRCLQKRADGGEGSRMYKGGEIEAEVMAGRPTSPNKHT